MITWLCLSDIVRYLIVLKIEYILGQVVPYNLRKRPNVLPHLSNRKSPLLNLEMNCLRHKTDIGLVLVVLIEQEF